jgi:hypothetical protein
MIDRCLYREVALAWVLKSKALSSDRGGKNILSQKARGQIVDGEMVAGGPAAELGAQHRITGDRHFSFAGGE